MKYSLRMNNLTKPSSFRPIVDIYSVLRTQQISTLINKKAPLVSIDDSMLILSLFREVCLDQLASGNGISIRGFLTMRPVFKPGKVDAHLDIIPSCSKCKAKVTPSKILIDDTRIKATFSFSGKPTAGRTSTRSKTPGTGSTDTCGVPIPGPTDVNVTALAKIIEVKSMPYNIQNHVHDNSGIVITGENMVYDPEIIDSGIWLKSVNNTSRLQSDIISIQNRTVRVVGEVDFSGGPAGQNSVEHSLRLARINSKGVQKDTHFPEFIRKTNIVTQDYNQLLLTGAQTGGPLYVNKFPGSESLYEIRCYKDFPHLKCKVVSVSSGDEDEKIISEDGDKLSFQTEDGTLDILVNSKETLISNIKKYGGFIREVAIISKIIEKISGWVSRTPSDSNSWSGSTNHNGLIIAVGRTGTGNRAMTSPDGLTWTSRNTDGDFSWRRVTSNNQVAVAIATGGEITISSDGKIWNRVTPPREAGLNDICYTGSYFIAVSSNQSFPEQVYRSNDGTNWDLINPGSIAPWFCCASNGAGRVVILSTNGKSKYSVDHGLTWQDSNIDSHSWQTVTHDGTQFIAVADDGYIMRGSGISWFTGPKLKFSFVENVYHDHGQIIVCSSDKSGSDIAVSIDDGETWEYSSTPIDAFWNCLTSNNDRFICVGNVGVISADLQ